MKCVVNVSQETLPSFLNEDRLESTVSLAHATKKLFDVMPYLEGIPGFLLNAAILVSVVAILRKNTNDSNRPALVFIGNLAVSDICLCFADVFLGVIRRPEMISEYKDRRHNICALQISIYLFCFWSNLFGTILITLDRYNTVRAAGNVTLRRY